MCPHVVRRCGGFAVCPARLDRRRAGRPWTACYSVRGVSVQTVVALLQNNRQFSVPRRKVITATRALPERELAKHAALAGALAAALEARGVEDLPAVLAARTDMAAFVLVTNSWLDGAKPSLGERLDLAASELKALLVGS